jgi:hypothetical protein
MKPNRTKAERNWLKRWDASVIPTEEDEIDASCVKAFSGGFMMPDANAHPPRRRVSG